jgi:hypothetical protein
MSFLSNISSISLPFPSPVSIPPIVPISSPSTVTVSPPPKEWPKPHPDCDCRTCVGNRIIRQEIKIHKIMGIPYYSSEGKITICMRNDPKFKEYIEWILLYDKETIELTEWKTQKNLNIK